MFCYNRRAFLYPNLRFKTLTTPSSFLLHLLQPFSSSSSSSSQNHAFTVNYLIQNCGFSLETASKLSKRVHLNDSQKPNSVLALFKSYGFSNSQLSTLIKKCPNLLSYDPNKTILPKLNFLHSKGASNSDLVHIITRNPRFLYQSLQNSLTPCYDFLKKFLLSDQSIIASIKCCPSLLSKTPSHNIQLLLQNGVPQSNIVLLFQSWNYVLTEHTPIFNKALEEVKELGFKPESTTFVVALRAKVNSKSHWEKKIDVYKKWGWSQKNIVSAFRKYPWCMLISVDKIDAAMNFFVNQMGWDSILLAKFPELLLYSLEKRVIPRAFVLQFLESKGLIKDAKLVTPFKVPEDAFLKRFVTCFEEEASQLLMLYEEKKDVSNNDLKKGLGPRPGKRFKGYPLRDHCHQLHSTVTVI